MIDHIFFFESFWGQDFLTGASFGVFRVVSLLFVDAWIRIENDRFIFVNELTTYFFLFCLVLRCQVFINLMFIFLLIGHKTIINGLNLEFLVNDTILSLKEWNLVRTPGLLLLSTQFCRQVIYGLLNLFLSLSTFFEVDIWSAFLVFSQFWKYFVLVACTWGYANVWFNRGRIFKSQEKVYLG